VDGALPQGRRGAARGRAAARVIGATPMHVSRTCSCTSSRASPSSCVSSAPRTPSIQRGIRPEFVVFVPCVQRAALAAGA
jgi:hypothetical protein